MLHAERINNDRDAVQFQAEDKTMAKVKVKGGVSQKYSRKNILSN